MKLNEMIATSPIAVEKTVRGDEIRGLTSARAGKIIPVAYFPLLREDRVTSGRMRIAIDMAETVHTLMNAINVTAYAHYIPFLAFERFTGMESFNRSYQGIGEPHNDTAIPFFTTVPFDRDAAFWKTLGVHWKEGEPINAAALEAYNVLVNFRRETRSKKLPLRELYDTTLAEAFWKNPMMSHIVPDFDQAMMDGEVELQFANSRLDVRSRNYGVQSMFAASTGTTVDMNVPAVVVGGSAPTIGVEQDFYTWGDEIFAEMRDSGIRLSLANIELAKQTAAFAKLRQRYQGLSDEHIIDLLMEGVRVPDEAQKQPHLLDRKSTIVGYSERHAMDGASLDMSVTTGTTSLELSFRTPPMNTGGVILVTLEIVPEQLFERLHDTFLGTTNPNTLPAFLRDYLDPEKVDVVPNKFVDVEHDVPEGTFGYAPLNHAWRRSFARIGGKYYRRNPDTFVEDRQKFWSVEQLNPTLTQDFYMVRDLPHSVFLDTISDPFEVLTLGSVQVVGNTVFGKLLDEDGEQYDAVYKQVDTSRIQQAGEE